MKGIIAASGMALARAFLVEESEIIIEERLVDDVPAELSRLKHAVCDCASRLEELMDSMEGEVEPETIEILDFQLLMLEDSDFTGKMEEAISSRSINAELAAKEISDAYISYLENITDNDYLRERAADVADLSQRLIAKIAGADADIVEPDCEYIAVSTDIPPSRVAELDKKRLKGIILEKGGITSHCVILSRSLGIPCLIEALGIIDAAGDSPDILLDAVSGEAVINPSKEKIEAYKEYSAGIEKEKASLAKYIDRASKTLDGAVVKVYANITMADEAVELMRQGAEGVGLFRSELLYMSQTNRPPSEKIQYEEYKRAAKALEGRPLIIRTLDIGGDKQVAYMNIGEEENPFLGYRAIRYCLDHPEIFKAQISAILRAGACGNVWMMFPMIAAKSELIAAKRIVGQVKGELAASNADFDGNMKIGMMIETPAAAIDAERFAAEVDFLSIGTNDLTQYLFAADRANSKVTYLNSSFQPTLLRVINHVVRSAKKAGIEVDICGQAGEILELVPLWVAMGVDNLSVSVPRVTSVRREICSLLKRDCDELLEEVLKLETAQEVERVLKEFAK